MENENYLESFEERLTLSLIERCKVKGVVLGDTFLLVDELNEKWDEMAPQYMADAIPQIKDYFSVAIAWGGYLGMGIASIWDTAWAQYQNVEDIYKLISTPRGFDAMDEYIVEDILGLKLESEEALKIEELMRSCAELTVSMIRREGIEPQSSAAFHIFTSSVKVFFKLGVSIELNRIGYKYEKVKAEVVS